MLIFVTIFFSFPGDATDSSFVCVILLCIFSSFFNLKPRKGNVFQYLLSNNSNILSFCSLYLAVIHVGVYSQFSYFKKLSFYHKQLNFFRSFCVEILWGLRWMFLPQERTWVCFCYFLKPLPIQDNFKFLSETNSWCEFRLQSHMRTSPLFSIYGEDFSHITSFEVVSFIGSPRWE